MRKSTRLLLKVPFFIVLIGVLLLGHVRSTPAQEADGVVPAGYQSGSFFSRQLGTALRFNYHTQGYGTQADVFSLGGMKVFNMDGATMFVDGQGTLSEDFGGGFNLGMGYRQLATLGASFDPERILGAGFWTDGQSTSADNFFTQLGFSLESLGESYDLRLNGSFPLERTQTSTATLSGTGSSLFSGSNLFNSTERVSIDTAHNVIDGEFAKRINDLEAWAFVGGYQLGGGGIDATGYRVGVRGYAVPDVALSLQVTDDDLYATNVLFGVTWFIGRTTANNGPCGTLLDRFREPVLRNDFIATTSRQVNRASGPAAIDPDTGLAKNFVFVDGDGTAAISGDGSFENPYNTLAQAQGALADNDTVFSFSASEYSDTLNMSPFNDVNFIGEGNDILHVCQTSNFGLVTLPESSVGARGGAAPILNLAAGQTGFTAGNNSQINNATIKGADIGVLADAISAPELANLAINDAGIGVHLRDITAAAVVENTVLINRSTGTGLLAEGGADLLSIGAGINDSLGRSLVVQGRTGGTVNFTGTIDDRATAAANFSDGVLIDANVNSTINLTNTLNIHVDGGETGIQISGNDATSSITIADLDATASNGDTVSVTGAGTVNISSADDTRTIANTGTGNAFFNDGATGSALITVNSNIENTVDGNAVRIENRAEAINAQFTGTVTATNTAGVLAQGNSDGTLLFTNTLTLSTDTNNAVELVGNTGATLSFTDLDIDTTSGDGFIATGGGTLIVSSLNGTNDIQVGTGVGVNLTDMTIDPGNVTFDVVGVGNGAGVGINLQNLDGTGQVAIGGGTNAGDGGTLTTATTAINVSNANNVALTNLTVSNVGVAQGVNVTAQQAGSSATFSGLDINTVNADAVNINGNDAGTVAFNTVAATTTGNGDGIDIANADGSNVTMSINNATVSATGTGRGFAATGGGTTIMAGTNEINTSGGTAFDVSDVESLSASNVTIANTTAQGVNVTGQNTNTDLVTLNNFNVTTTTAEAVRVADNSNGTVNLTSLTAESTAGATLAIDNNTGATVTINGMNLTSTSGPTFSATNGGTLTATGANNVDATTGRGVNIQDMTIGGGGVTFSSVDVTAGLTNGVNLSDNTGGTITVNGGAMTTAGTALSITNSDSVAINNVDVTNTAGAGLIASNIAGDALSLSNVDFETTSGIGVDVNGGTLTATGTNTVTTTTGTGLDISNATIGGGGASFSSVDVTGATNGIVLADLSGGQVRVGAAAATGTDGDGGSISTTGTAISVTGVTNALFNDVTVSSSGAADVVTVNHTTALAATVTFQNLGLTTSGTGNGVVLTDSGTGEIDFTLRDSTVNVAVADTIGFDLITGNNAGIIDIRLDGNTIIAGDNSAVAADISAGSGNVQYLVNGGNDWTNTSATDATASFLVSTARTLNATIGDQNGTAPFDENRFTNLAGASTAFSMESNAAAATISLDLRGNTAAGTVDFLLTETLGTFGVVDLTDTVTNEILNAGGVDLGGGGFEADFDDLAPPIPQVD